MSGEEGCAREGGLCFSPRLVRARYPFVAVRAYGLVPPGSLGPFPGRGRLFCGFHRWQDIAAAHSDGFLERMRLVSEYEVR